MKKKKKGFTLTELLSVIAIIGLIFAIVFYSYTSYIKISKEKIKKVETEQILEAASLFYSEFEGTDEYVSYIDDNGITNSCISLQSLINKGYYKGNVSFLDEKLTKDNVVIKVKKENGVADYELLSNYVRDEDCIYYDYSSEIGADTEMQINSNDSNSISLDASITNNSNDNNIYILKLKFSADVYDQIVSYAVPLYVMQVLDRSGSMKGEKYDKAVQASVELSNSLIDKFEEANIGLIEFNDKAILKKNFSHQKFKTTDFVNPKSGYTNIVGALDLAYNTMKNETSDIEAIKYIIFLTDGVPELKSSADGVCYKLTEACQDEITKYSLKIKDDLNAYFVVIGYNINQDIYKIITSVDETGTICPDSDYTQNGKNYCYYSSNSANISSLFNSLSNSIEKKVKEQSVSRSVINTKFNQSIKLYDARSNEVTDFSVDIDFNDPNKNVLEQEYIYYISFDNFDDDKFTCNYENEECTYKFDLFEEYYVDLYDMDNNYFNKLELSEFPSITITKKLKSYIN